MRHSEGRRRRKMRVRLTRMLEESGFGKTLRDDGTVIERRFDVMPLVDFAVRNRLDGESSARIYELYARDVYNRAQQQESSRPVVAETSRRACVLL